MVSSKVDYNVMVHAQSDAIVSFTVGYNYDGWYTHSLKQSYIQNLRYADFTSMSAETVSFSQSTMMIRVQCPLKRKLPFSQLRWFEFNVCCKGYIQSQLRWFVLNVRWKGFIHNQLVFNVRRNGFIQSATMILSSMPVLKVSFNVSYDDSSSMPVLTNSFTVHFDEFRSLSVAQKFHSQQHHDHGFIHK